MAVEAVRLPASASASRNAPAAAEVEVGFVVVAVVVAVVVVVVVAAAVRRVRAPTARAHRLACCTRPRGSAPARRRWRQRSGSTQKTKSNAQMLTRMRQSIPPESRHPPTCAASGTLEKTRKIVRLGVYVAGNKNS